MKVGTCAHDKRALQQLALNVHIKHTDPEWVVFVNIFISTISTNPLCINLYLKITNLDSNKSHCQACANLILSKHTICILFYFKNCFSYCAAYMCLGTVPKESKYVT